MESKPSEVDVKRYPEVEYVEWKEIPDPRPMGIDSVWGAKCYTLVKVPWGRNE